MLSVYKSSFILCWNLFLYYRFVHFLATLKAVIPTFAQDKTLNFYKTCFSNVISFIKLSLIFYVIFTFGRQKPNADVHTPQHSLIDYIIILFHQEKRIFLETSLNTQNWNRYSLFQGAVPWPPNTSGVRAAIHLAVIMANVRSFTSSLAMILT